MHEGAVGAIVVGNPYAAFTLLRAYAENAAALVYLKDKPAQLEVFWRDFDGSGIPIGRMTNYASTRMAEFKSIYSQLSKYAHPHALSVFASTQDRGENGFHWQSQPAFKSENDRRVACAWVVELAVATSHLLVEFAIAQGWQIGTD